MSITKVIRQLIDTNTYIELTAATGNADVVLISNVVYANDSFANTSNTDLPLDGGYLKLYGSGFQSGVNVFVGNANTVANLVSNTELWIAVPPLSADVYDLFLYNPDGSNAIVINGVNVLGSDYTHGWFSGGALSGPTGTIHKNFGRFPSSPVPANNPVINLSNGNNNFLPNIFAHGTLSTQIERLTFANDTNANDARANLNGARWHHSGARNYYNGYFAGADAPFGTTIPGTAPINPVPTIAARTGTSNVSKFTFADDSAAVQSRFNLTTARYGQGSAENTIHSWFTLGGGASSPTVANPSLTSTERMTFANDTASTTGRGNASLARHFVASSRNSSYGWFAGGTKVSPNNSGPNTELYSRIDRIDFSNDSNVALVRGDQLISAHSSVGVSTETFGWFHGGQRNFLFDVDDIPGTTSGSFSPAPGPIGPATVSLTIPSSRNIGNEYSAISRLDFTNDVVNTLQRAPMPKTMDSASLENSTYGWFSSGMNAPSNMQNQLSSSIGTSPGPGSNPLPIAYNFSAGFPGTTSITSPSLLPGNPIQDLTPSTPGTSYRWTLTFNYNPTYVSTINRLTFASDTTAVSTRTAAIQANRGGAGVSGRL